jgi:hypothetical protein
MRITTGVAVTAVVLATGLAAMSRNGTGQIQQKFMRMRVGAQGVTLGAVFLSLYAHQRAKELGLV